MQNACVCSRVKNPNESSRLPELRSRLQEKISNLLNEYKTRGFLNGYSGDLIRPSLCSFIENISRSMDYFRPAGGENCFSTETVDTWQSILDECISNLDDDVRQAALAALKSFSHACYANSR